MLPDCDYHVPLEYDLLELVARLQRLGYGPEAHAFVRPLASTFEVLCEAATANRVGPTLLLPLLAAAVEFLLPSETPARHLEFALSVHKEHASTSRFVRSIAELTPPEFQARWLRSAEELTFRCQEVWELHAYFVFLDIKGDRALFEQTALRLSHVLELPVRSFVGCLAHARPFVEDILRALAGQQLRELLERRHAEALQQWHTAWMARIQNVPDRGRPVEEAQNDSRFWEVYFTHLLKITWPDFTEAFEHFFLHSRCPVDLVHQLRLCVDPTWRHQVLRSAWQDLLQKHSRARHLVSAMLANILENIGSSVYRVEPLRCFHRLSSPSAGCHSLAGPFQEYDGPSQHGGAAVSSTAASTASAHGGFLSKAAKATPWVPFGHSGAGDADMSIPTPHDLHVHARHGTAPDRSSETGARQPTLEWDDYVARLCAESRPWWETPDEAISEDSASEEPLQMAALRAVNSSIVYTHRALIFRVVSGDLAQNSPILELPSPDGEVVDKDDLLPSLVIQASGTRYNGITKFGRTSSRRTLLPDCPMGEPIASRSHFNVVYMQDTDRYCLMDAGSKWGTFVKIGASMPLSCGDWIRVGGVEFIIRFCGGICACSRHHVHYRLHGLRLLREQQAADRVHIPRPLLDPRRAWAKDARKQALRAQAGGAGGGVPAYPQGGEGASSSDEEDAESLEDELLLLLNSRRRRGWTTVSTRLCQRTAMRDAGLPAGIHRPSEPRTASSSSSAPARRPISLADDQRLWDSPMPVPIAPLELDFISGPRMGEKLVLSERVCTLGRGEGNSIQVNDSQLASVSRVHCIFEFRGNWWYIRDNGSTNGTWRRLSCILEPSDPIELHQGVSIQAGAHEFFVEEATMRQSLFPSTASQSFEELCEQERQQSMAVPSESMTPLRGHRPPAPEPNRPGT